MHLKKGLFFSEDAQSARVEILYDEASINIIIEDSGKEYVYEKIFSRLMPESQIKFLGVGGKQAVLTFYKEKLEEVIPSRKQSFFYILDGDFDRYLAPERMVNDSACIYLEAYNVENYYIDEDACINFIQGRLKLLPAQAKKKLNFTHWKDKIVSEATKLFILYAYIQKNFPEEPNIARPHGEFIDYTTGFQRTDEAFDEYENKYKLNDNFIDSCQSIKSDFKKINGENYFNLICGKFLITSLTCYIKTKLKSSASAVINNEDFQWHLVNNFDVSSLDYLKNAVNSFINSSITRNIIVQNTD